MEKNNLTLNILWNKLHIAFLSYQRRMITQRAWKGEMPYLTWHYKNAILKDKLDKRLEKLLTLTKY